jgi:pilus assembly protein CpaC
MAAFWLVLGGFCLPASAQQATNPSLIHEVHAPKERLEMTVNTSRILSLDKKIPQAQVNNPEILELTPLSPTQIQVFAKKTGVTQVNLWGEGEKIFTVDVIVYGDAQELSMLLQSQFPNAALKVIPVSNGVLISGYVDQPEHVGRIVQISEEYYPNVINNITVGGVQQVLLHVKVMEVSRTKLRALGFDFTKFTNGTAMFSSTVSGLISGIGADAVSTPDDANMVFKVVDGGSSFFGVLQALRDDQLMKVLAEPTLVTVSGRPAFFQVGGEFPILVPQSMGTVSIEFKKFGTQVDFVPIVLGNGRIRLEVRPRVSEVDNTRSVEIGGTTIPGLRVREVDTGVEMKAGQTLAIAGLVQNRVEAQRRGVPWVSDLPYVGALFRKVEEQMNEIELLVMVTPELVEAMDPNQVPTCGPGTTTTSPNDWELGLRGHIEVPKCCPPGPGSENAATYGSNAAHMPMPGALPAMSPVEQNPLNQPEPIPTPDPSESKNNTQSPNGAAPESPSDSRAPSEPQTWRLVPPTGNRSASLKGQIRSNKKYAHKRSGGRASAQPPGFIGPVGYERSD